MNSYPQTRVERLIAIGRACVAALSLPAIWLDPSAPSRYAAIAYTLLATYAVYSVLLCLWIFSLDPVPARLGLVTHVLDLVSFTLFQYFTEGATSPFFVYFAFSMVCATLRWRLRGVLWTALVALGTFLGLGLFASHVLRDHDFEMNRFIIRAAYLMVMAGLLGCLGAYEQRRQGEVSKLAKWPTLTPQETPAIAREMLERAADILTAPRVLMAWAEPEEPWLHLASRDRGEFVWTRESPAPFQRLVAGALISADFFCSDASIESPTVVHASSNGFHHWEGVPIHPDLRARFSMSAVLSVRLLGECVEGRLFFLDKATMTSDDLILGRIIARQVASAMDHSFLDQRLQHTVVTEERIRLARNLHDSLLQNLTGTALQLQAACRLLEEKPEAAEDRLLAIQGAIAAGQRDLRLLIEELKPVLPGVSRKAFNLDALLKELGKRVERQWGLRVNLTLDGRNLRIQNGLGMQVYRIIHEALANAARHANASAVRVEVGGEDGQMRIMVADNGRGFHFQGSYDHPALTWMEVGPVSLRERVAALGGSLAIDSRDTGATLDIRLPLTGRGA